MDVITVLQQFSDTILFEYDCTKQTTEFFPALPDEWGRGSHPSGAPDEIASKLAQVVALVMRTGQPVRSELSFRAQNGRFHFFLCHCKPAACMETPRIIGKLTDITDRFDREQDLLRQSRTDVLTGLYNRSAEALINEQLIAAKGGVLFMVDLDDFKRINDTYGHSLGDQVLVEVSSLLRRLFRPNDIIARVGGDEFIIFMKGKAKAALAQSRAQLILDELKKLHVPGVNLPISMCIGIALSPPLPADYEQLHEAADSAMYDGKHASKHSWHFHSESR